jgi:hypothetical protein
MANIILPAVPVLNEIDDSTKLLIEQAGEINRYPISDLDIGGGDITIEIDSSAKEKPQSPLYSTSNDTHFYPLTTADQVILDDGNRLDDEISKYLTVELEGEAAEPNGINADTLGGYAADEYVRKDQYGIELNYRVVGSVEEPTNPTQNMIWIQTETPIGRVFFGNDEPNETFMDGDVWITTGNSSNVAFNSLKIGNSYMDKVYPISAKLFVNGAWVDVTAKSYQNGAWVDWIRFNVMYDSGNKNETVTGGWVKKGDHVAVTENADSMKIESSQNGNTSWYHTQNKIDITKYSKLIFDGIVNVTRMNTETVFGINDTMQSFNSGYLAKYYANEASDGIIEVDVSGITGKHYVCFEVRDSGQYFVVRKLYFE